MTAVGAWGFGEGSGTTAADATGNGHTLTLADATWEPSGHTGSALTNTTADTGASGTVPAITGAVTLMAWVKPLDLTAGTTKFIAGIMQGGGNTDVALFAQRGSFGTPNVLQADVRINGNLTACNGTGPLAVGTWTHVAVTYDGSAIRLYRDGVLETVVSTSGSISLGTTFYVAGALTAASVDSDVVVDDTRLDDAALSQATIATLKDTPVGGVDERTQSGVATITLGGSGTQLAERTGSGTATVTLGATGTAVHERVASGTATLVLGADGASVAERSGSGSAALTLGTTGTHDRETALVGAAPLVLGGDGASLKEAAQSGSATLTLLATGVVAGETIPTATDPRLTVRPNLAVLTVTANSAVLTSGGTG